MSLCVLQLCCYCTGVVGQIPSALTADIEVERKQREAEKKKAQKKAKQERLKVSSAAFR